MMWQSWFGMICWAWPRGYVESERPRRPRATRAQASPRAVSPAARGQQLELFPGES